MAKKEYRRNTAMKTTFDSLFHINADGSFSPKKPLTIGDITLSSDDSFSPEISISGLELSSLQGMVLDVEESGEGFVLNDFSPRT